MRKTLHSADYARFLALLKQARKDAGMVQQELADKLGKPQSFVAKFERGERRIDVIEFIAIARAIGRDPVACSSNISSRSGPLNRAQAPGVESRLRGRTSRFEISSGIESMLFGAEFKRIRRDYEALPSGCPLSA